jgi:hypothetical protein
MPNHYSSISDQLGALIANYAAVGSALTAKAGGFDHCKSTPYAKQKETVTTVNRPWMSHNILSKETEWIFTVTPGVVIAVIHFTFSPTLSNAARL